MYRFLFFYANVIVNKNEVLNKVKLKLKLKALRQLTTDFPDGSFGHEQRSDDDPHPRV